MQRLISALIAGLMFVFGGLAQAQNETLQVPSSAELGTSVTATIGGAGIELFYQLDWGDGSVPVEFYSRQASTSKQHTYFQSGAYIVKLKRQTTQNNFTLLTQSTIVISLPVPTFSVAPTEVQPNQQVTATAGNLRGTVLYTLDFGDGSQQYSIAETTTAIVKHAYTSVGTYTVKLTYPGGAPQTQIVRVVAPPCTLEVTPSPATVGATVTAKVTGLLVNFSGVLEWGDGTKEPFVTGGNQTTFTSTYTYSQAKVATVRVLSGTIPICTTTLQVTLPIPILNVTPTSAQVNQQVTAALTNLVPSVTYTLEWGDGQSDTFSDQTAASIKHSYGAAGTFVVKLTASGITPQTQSVTVIQPACALQVTPSPATPGANITAKITGLPNAFSGTIDWGDTTSDAFTANASGAFTATHVFNTVKTYVIKMLSGSTTICTASLQVAVPTPTFAVAPTNLQVNQQTTATLGNLLSSVTYTLAWGDGQDDTVTGQAAANIKHAYVTAGTFVVKLTALGITPLAQTITVIQPSCTVQIMPVPAILDAAITAKITGLPNAFAGTIDWGDTISDAFTANATGAFTATHTFNTIKTYVVKVLSGTTPICTASVQITIPTPTLAVAPAEVQIDQQVTATIGNLISSVNYTLDWGDAQNETITGQASASIKHAYAKSGTFVVKLTTAGIAPQTQTVLVIVPTCTLEIAPAQGVPGVPVTASIKGLPGAQAITIDWGDTNKDAINSAQNGTATAKHTFDAPKLYVIKVLFGTTPICTGSVQIAIPQATLSVTPDTIQPGQSVTANLGNLVSSLTYTIEWSDGNADTVTGKTSASIKHTYTSVAKYPVKLSVPGGTAQIQFVSVAYPNPAESISATPNPAIVDQAVTFKLANLIKGQAYTLEYGDLSSDTITAKADGTASIKHTFAKTKVHVVRLTLNGETRAQPRAILSLTVNDAPKVEIEDVSIEWAKPYSGSSAIIPPSNTLYDAPSNLSAFVTVKFKGGPDTLDGAWWLDGKLLETVSIDLQPAKRNGSAKITNLPTIAPGLHKLEFRYSSVVQGAGGLGSKVAAPHVTPPIIYFVQPTSFLLGGFEFKIDSLDFAPGTFPSLQNLSGTATHELRLYNGTSAQYAGTLSKIKFSGLVGEAKQIEQKNDEGFGFVEKIPYSVVIKAGTINIDGEPHYVNVDGGSGPISIFKDKHIMMIPVLSGGSTLSIDQIIFYPLGSKISGSVLTTLPACIHQEITGKNNQAPTNNNGGTGNSDDGLGNGQKGGSGLPGIPGKGSGVPGTGGGGLGGDGPSVGGPSGPGGPVVGPNWSSNPAIGGASPQTTPAIPQTAGFADQSQISAAKAAGPSNFGNIGFAGYGAMGAAKIAVVGAKVTGGSRTNTGIKNLQKGKHEVGRFTRKAQVTNPTPKCVGAGNNTYQITFNFTDQKLDSSGNAYLNGYATQNVPATASSSGGVIDIKNTVDINGTGISFRIEDGSGYFDLSAIQDPLRKELEKTLFPPTGIPSAAKPLGKDGTWAGMFLLNVNVAPIGNKWKGSKGAAEEGFETYQSFTVPVSIDVGANFVLAASGVLGAVNQWKFDISNFGVCVYHNELVCGGGYGKFLLPLFDLKQNGSFKNVYVEEVSVAVGPQYEIITQDFIEHDFGSTSIVAGCGIFSKQPNGDYPLVFADAFWGVDKLNSPASTTSLSQSPQARVLQKRKPSRSALKMQVQSGGFFQGAALKPGSNSIKMGNFYNDTENGPIYQGSCDSGKAPSVPNTNLKISLNNLMISPDGDVSLDGQQCQINTTVFKPLNLEFEPKEICIQKEEGNPYELQLVDRNGYSLGYGVPEITARLRYQIDGGGKGKGGKDRGIMLLSFDKLVTDGATLANAAGSGSGFNATNTLETKVKDKVFSITGNATTFSVLANPKLQSEIMARGLRNNQKRYAKSFVAFDPDNFEYVSDSGTIGLEGKFEASSGAAFGRNGGESYWGIWANAYVADGFGVSGVKVHGFFGGVAYNMRWADASGGKLRLATNPFKQKPTYQSGSGFQFNGGAVVSLNNDGGAAFHAAGLITIDYSGVQMIADGWFFQAVNEGYGGSNQPQANAKVTINDQGLTAVLCVAQSCGGGYDSLEFVQGGPTFLSVWGKAELRIGKNPHIYLGVPNNRIEAKVQKLGIKFSGYLMIGTILGSSDTFGSIELPKGAQSGQIGVFAGASAYVKLIDFKLDIGCPVEFTVGFGIGIDGGIAVNPLLVTVSAYAEGKAELDVCEVPVATIYIKISGTIKVPPLDAELEICGKVETFLKDFGGCGSISLSDLKLP
jgi:PKD repeat protein